MSQYPAICIIGMHRSGTSMVAHLLNICGLELGPREELLPPGADNPMGYFENERFLQINEALLDHLGASWHSPPGLEKGWERDPSLAPLVRESRTLIDSFSQCPHWGWKDPRTTILIPFWRSLIPDLRFVICARNPLEVAQSLSRRNGFSIEFGSNLWYHYMRSAVIDTAGASRLLTFYEDYFNDSLDEIDRIARFCSLRRPDDPSLLRATVSRQLRHHDSQLAGLFQEGAVPTRHKIFYSGLRPLSIQVDATPMPESASDQDPSDVLNLYVDLFTDLPSQEVLSRLQNELAEREDQVAALSGAIEQNNRVLAERNQAQARLEAELGDLNRRLQEKDRQLAEINFHFLRMQETIGWTLLEKLRGLIPAGSKRRTFYLILRRSIELTTQEGPGALFIKARRQISLARKGGGILVKFRPDYYSPASPRELDSQYQIWFQRHTLTGDDLARKQADVQTLSYAPCISIATPVYDTEEVWLRRAIDSVLTQIYSNWELCLVNDASPVPGVRSVLDEYAAADSRIKVKHLGSNQGATSAFNHALAMATSPFVGLLDHDDELPPDALYEAAKLLDCDPHLDLLYTDEDKLDPDGHHVDPFFKPDWSPDLLLSMNYIGRFSIFRRSLLEQIEGFRVGFDGSQGHDLLLRFTELTDRIAHIPKILYHRRTTADSAAGSTNARPDAHKADLRAIKETLRRNHREAMVEDIMPGRYRVRYELEGSPLVSIIIPTKDKWQLLQQCINSIEEKTAYPWYEVIVIDNNSVEPGTQQYLDKIAEKWRVYRYSDRFNFAAINNFAVTRARGEHLLFLNNDTQVIRSDWLTGMLEHSQHPEVGAVGARLLYPDRRIQHAGVVLGVGGVAGHAFKYLPDDGQSYFDLGDLVRNCSAITGACMMVPRRVFEEVNGFDERFRVAFNDIDLCLRIGQLGYRRIYTPVALLYHHESASRGNLQPLEDEVLMWEVWGDLIRKGDPYYNRNLTLSREDWSLPG